MPHQAHERKPTHRALHDDHRQLDELYDELINASDAGVDVRTLGDIWSRFERGLRSHMALEEEIVFPAVQAAHPAEIVQLLAVHDQIRSKLDEVGLAVDLHFVRSPEVSELVDLVRAHAVNEDDRLYAWAESEVPAAERPNLLQRIRDQWSAGTDSPE